MNQNYLLFKGVFLNNKEVELYIKLVREYLEECWDTSTAFKCEGIGKGKSRGQCYVTALLIKKLFGGCILKGKIMWNNVEETHFWNCIDTEEKDFIDLTSDQYNGDGFNPVISKGRTYSKPNFRNRRFLMLCRRYKDVKGLFSKRL